MASGENFSLYVLPGGTWIYSSVDAPSDLRLAAALALDSRAPPAIELEPGAVIAEYVAKEDARYGTSPVVIPFVGAELVTGRTCATFPSTSGAMVPALLRLHLPSAQHADAAARDSNLQAAVVRARYGNGDPPRERHPLEFFGSTAGPAKWEGDTLAYRGFLPYAALASYVSG